MSRGMYSAMGIGLVWSAINVGTIFGRTFGQGGPRLAFWLASFGIELMISMPILYIMDQAATAARIGQRVDRARIVSFELALLLATVGLNAGPHLAGRDPAKAALYAAAPIMVVVCMWLHAWMAARYATMIKTVSSAAPSGANGRLRAHDDAVGSVPGVRDLALAFPLSDRPAPVPARVDGASGHEIDDCERIAHMMVAQRSARVPEDHLVFVLRHAQAGWNANAIALKMRRLTTAPIHRSTIDRHILCARSLGLQVPLPRIEARPGVRTA
ncbi:hypothetical protein [Nocardia sp. GP40]|uniref:hypothetical protein n=1 Tax=Nocardia sp. GP40 TaxID=3156268 RepID=UPI003D23F0D8